MISIKNIEKNISIQNNEPADLKQENTLITLEIDQNLNNPIIIDSQRKKCKSFSNNIESCVAKSNELERESNKIKFNNESLNDMLKHLRNETIKLFLKAFQVKNKWLKTYLIVLLAFCTSVSAYMLAKSIDNYLEFEILTTTRSITETSSVFPKITICNYNPFQTEYALEFLVNINEQINSSVNIFDVEQRKNLSKYELNDLIQRINNRAIIFMNSLNFTDEQRRMLGHDLNDLIFNCNFGYFDCTPEHNFDWYFDKYLGNCYTFKNYSLVDVPGEDGLLYFNFYLNFNQNLTFFNSFTSNLGAVMRIQNNSFLTDTSLVSGNIYLMPHTDYSIKISRSFEFSLPKPYSNCDIGNEDQERFIQNNYYVRLFAESIYQYTRQACFVQCFQKNLIQNCSCTDSSKLSLFNVSGCFDEDEIICKKEYWNEFTWDICLDLCPLECNKTNYKSHVSSVQLIGDYYAYLIRDNVNLARDFCRQEINAEMGAKSFVSLSIYYETLSYDISFESPKMNAVDLLANIGGNLSLFLGLSIFTLFELIEIFFEIYFLRK